jgi:hypothetical protein
MDGERLRYEQRPDPRPPSNFDLQMMDLIDRSEIVPVRLVNRQAMLGDTANGHDKFRRRISIGQGPEAGVNASSVDVVTRGGQVLTPEAYLELLAREREEPAGAAAR